MLYEVITGPQQLQPMALEAHVGEQRRAKRPGEVGQRRAPEPRVELAGDGGAADVRLPEGAAGGT